MNTTLVLMGVMAATGLAGGFGHCLGMCGPIVIAYTSAYRIGGLMPHVLYALGRITTYAMLGAAAGFAGSLVPLAAPTMDIQRWVMAATGALVMLMGLGMAGRGPILRAIERMAPSMPLVNRARAFFGSGLTRGAYYPLGVVMGFIPCGLVYTALVASARAAMDLAGPGGIARGTLMMLAFGIGTLPAMLMAAGASTLLSARLRAGVSGVGAGMMIAAGAVFMMRALWY